MKLKKNSISAKLYRLFYMTDYMPNNLCPYFWKLFAMYILLIPSLIFIIPNLIINKDEVDDWGDRFMVSVVFYVLILVIISTLFAPISLLTVGAIDAESPLSMLQTFGIIIWFLGLSFLSYHFVEKLINKIKYNLKHKEPQFIYDDNGDYVANPNYKPKEDKNNIIIEFIKAKFKAYCPKIDWE